MLNNLFVNLYSAIKKKKWFISGIIILITLIAAFNIKAINFDNNIELMLPDNGDVKKTLQFLRGSKFSDKVVISLSSSSDNYSIQDLITITNKFSDSLKPPMVTSVITGVDVDTASTEIFDIIKYLPNLFDQEMLLSTEEKIGSSNIKNRIDEIFKQSLSPGSSFFIEFMRSDPLGLTTNILKLLQNLSSSMGYNIEIVNDNFVSLDGKHTMLILESPINITDGFGSKKLISYIKEKLKVLPDNIEADIISGHLHSISNENVLKKDIRLTLTIASIAFILLFILVFRDIRAILIFIIPFVAILLSIHISSFVMNTLSYFIVGMGAVVAGIAIDYGIHVYVSVRDCGSEPESLMKIINPLFIGALTTVTVFISFFFSKIQGYHQLAFFSVVSVILCLFYSLFLLPHFIKRDEKKIKSIYNENHNLWKPGKIYIYFWYVFLFIGILSTPWIRFDNDVNHFDGSEYEIISAEDNFHDIWGGEDKPAIFVSSGESLEKALQINELIYNEVISNTGIKNFSNIAKILPSESYREKNKKRWLEFWTKTRTDAVKSDIDKYGAKYNFSKNAFNPFFNAINTNAFLEPSSLILIKQLMQQYIIENNGKIQVLSFFTDDKDSINKLSKISKKYENTFIVSRNALSNSISEAVSSEIIFIATISIGLIFLLIFVLLRSLILSLIALVPVLSGAFGVIIIVVIAGGAIDAPSVIAAMVIVGLCIDYGVFMIYACKNNMWHTTYKAVTLSAVSTIIGAGVLLFAKHPVLFSIGRTIVPGIFFGYISSIIIVPYLYNIRERSMPLHN